MASVAFKGIGEIVATFEIVNSVEKGAVVNVSKEGAVVNATANSAFLGVVRSTSDFHCSVQIGGYTEASYTGTKPGYGNTILASNGGSGVKVHTDGRKVHVVSVNEAEGIVGFFFV